MYAKMPGHRPWAVDGSNDAMWFIGLFAGLLLGSIFVGGNGTLWGGLLGALAGALISYLRGQSSQPEIEARLAALEAAVRELRQNASRAPGTSMPADVSQPAPASAPATLETPVVIPHLVTEGIAPAQDRPIGAGDRLAQSAAGPAAPEPVHPEPVSSQPPD